MTGTDVLVTNSDGVCELTLNRPARLNAWTPETGVELSSRLLEADGDPDVRAIVITGSGRGFCSGADMAALGELASGARTASVSAHPVALPALLGTPVIAAVNGACAGLGMVLALSCDVRFASTSAVFTTSFVQRGLVAEHGIAWLLPRLVGLGNAADLLLSARRVDAAEALRIGLVEAVLPPEDLLPRAWEYARALAENSSPTAMASIKRSLTHDQAATLEEAIAYAGERMTESFTWPDLAEGVASFTEKRAPRFPPRT